MASTSVVVGESFYDAHTFTLKDVSEDVDVTLLFTPDVTEPGIPSSQVTVTYLPQGDKHVMNLVLTCVEPEKEATTTLRGSSASYMQPRSKDPKKTNRRGQVTIHLPVTLREVDIHTEGRLTVTSPVPIRTCLSLHLDGEQAIGKINEVTLLDATSVNGAELVVERVGPDPAHKPYMTLMAERGGAIVIREGDTHHLSCFARAGGLIQFRGGAKRGRVIATGRNTLVKVDGGYEDLPSTGSNRNATVLLGGGDDDDEEVQPKRQCV